MSNNNFEPKIVGFLCNWCSYRGANTAGTARLKSAPNVRIVRVMCSGRVDPTFVLKAFKQGADGVLVLGCHPGDCHYAEGNYKTARRMPLLKKMLNQLGIEDDRVRLDWVSASEGARFTQVVNEITAKVKELGPFSRDEGKRNPGEAWAPGGAHPTRATKVAAQVNEPEAVKPKERG